MTFAREQSDDGMNVSDTAMAPQQGAYADMNDAEGNISAPPKPFVKVDGRSSSDASHENENSYDC